MTNLLIACYMIELESHFVVDVEQKGRRAVT